MQLTSHHDLAAFDTERRASKYGETNVVTRPRTAHGHAEQTGEETSDDAAVW
jgi:hypothetical protein